MIEAGGRANLLVDEYDDQGWSPASLPEADLFVTDDGLGEEAPAVLRCEVGGLRSATLAPGLAEDP